MKATSNPRWAERFVGLATLLVLIALLEWTVRAGALNAAIVPPPSLIVGKLVAILSAGMFLEPLLQTLRLLAIAYGIGCLLGIALGLVMGRYSWAHDLLEPLVEVLRPLPKPALLPPLILFLGLGDSMKLTVISLGVFFPVLINTIQGVRGTEQVLIDAARTFGHGRAPQMFKVILPSALPLIFSGMRVSLGLGLVLVVIAEMLAGTGGVGFLIIDMQRSFRIADMYAWIVILAVLGFVLNKVFLQLERWAIHWSFAMNE